MDSAEIRREASADTCKLYIVNTLLYTMTTETVSFRIRKELKELARKYNLDISKMAREKVENELSRLQQKEREEAFQVAARALSKVTSREIASAVRKTRDSR